MLFETCLPGVMFKALACCKRLNWSFSIRWVKPVRRWYLLSCDPGSSAQWVRCRMCLNVQAFTKCRTTSVLISEWDWEAKSRCFIWWCLRCGQRRDVGCLAVEFQEVVLLMGMKEPKWVWCYHNSDAEGQDLLLIILQQSQFKRTSMQIRVLALFCFL